MADIVKALPVTSRSLERPAVAGTATLIAGAVGYKIRIIGLMLNANGTIAVALQDAHTTFMTAYLTAGSHVVMPEAGNGWVDSVSGDAVSIVLGATGVNVGGRIIYQYIPSSW